jgi:methyl-accepting chemotaxis protein
MANRANTIRHSPLWRPGLSLMGGLGLRGKVLLLLLVLGLPAVAAVPLLFTAAARAGDGAGLLRLAGFAIGGGILAATYLCVVLHRGIAGNASTVMRTTQSMIEGDLTRRITVEGRDELARIGHSIEAMNASLSATVANIHTMSALVKQTATTLARDNGDLSRRTEQQAASLEETSASVQDIARTVQSNDEAAHHADTQARELSGLAETGAGAMRDAVARMDGIEKSSRKASEIVSLIDGIAFQTNILALNAAVEAARAGDQGRGFAVVASEVRSLARRSSEAAREIKTLIDSSTGEVAEGARRIRGVNSTLDTIVGGIRDVATQVRAIATDSASQSAALKQITSVVGELDGITQNNARMVENAANLARELGERADGLAATVSTFRLRQGTANEAMEMTERALEQTRRLGIAAALDAFSDPARGFHDRDLYVFAIDRAGTYRAFGGKPEKVGSSIIAVIGAGGKQMVADAFARASQGGGWVEYEIINPLTQTAAPKMSFMKALGNDLAIGCGVYKTVALEAALALAR